MPQRSNRIFGPVVATSLFAAMSFVGCDAEPTQTTARFSLSVVGATEGAACFALRITDKGGETTFAAGERTMRPATLSAAKAAGAVCAEGSGTAQVVGRCKAGPSEARVWFVGVFGTGVRAEDADFVDPCGEDGCAKSFECVAGQETSVTTDFTLVRSAQQGFFDLGVMARQAPEGADGICYAVRVVNGLGELVTSAKRICSTDYGNGSGGDITYVVPCDAEHPDNTVSIWVHAPEGATTPFETSCPAPTVGELATWAGGCVQTHTCVKNQDVTVLFDFEGEER